MSMDAAALAAIPDLYETERTPLVEKIVHAHYFVGSCDWYVMELDRKEYRIAFGWANLGDDQNAELGYFDLEELAQVAVRHPSGLTLRVERDLHWQPVRFGDLRVSS